MKKLFLIPLLALFSCVMAWAEVRQVSSYKELQDALSVAVDGDEIIFTKDIAYPATVATGSTLNITKSITLNGQNHKLTGYGMRSNGVKANLVINDGEASVIDVTIKNISIEKGCTYPINIRGNVHSLNIDNAVVDATNAIISDAYYQGLTISGNTIPDDYSINVTNSTIKTPQNKAAYAIIFWVPVSNISIENTDVMGWSVLYFKPGSNGTTVEAKNCSFDAQNFHSGRTNSFGAFALEDNGIDITLDNCVVDSRTHTENFQAMFMLSEWMLTLKNQDDEEFTQDRCSMTITGDNSQILGQFFYNSWVGTEADCPVLFTITGGTYFEEDITDARAYITIPDGYETAAYNVTNNGVATTVYRVRKEITGSTALNDNAGQNETEQIKVEANVTLANEETVAEYVEVANNAVVTVPEGKTLEVTNGLDVTDGAKVVVEAGSTLIVGEGGVTAETTESIVIEANENGAASLLLDPAVIVNTTPNLTVKMTAKQIGKDAFGDYYWHRFAMPVAAGITSWDKEGSYTGATQTYPTYIYGWDYANNDWLNLPGGVADMVPLQGYTLTLASDYIDGGITDLQDVVYTFKGNLIGNTDQALNFQARGFNFFGNSYTGYMDVLTLIQGIENSNVEGTVYMWNTDDQSYEAVSLYKLQNARQRARLEDWQKEVAPMQTFILRLRGVDSADESVNYASAIWGNPRYGNVATPAPARRTLAASSEETYMEIVVTAANGKSDRVDFTAMAGNSDAFESGYDAVKYMNERRMNIFSTVAGEDYSSVVTDNIEGKTISLSTKDDIRYTLSFRNVEGEAYAIRDNVTGAVTNIAEGNTYEFTAQPNALNADRFSIVAVRPVTTGVENIEAAAKAQGIYTVLGQYIGAREMWNSLPAGIYVVDGVKLVK